MSCVWYLVVIECLIVVSGSLFFVALNRSWSPYSRDLAIPYPSILSSSPSILLQFLQLFLLIIQLPNHYIYFPYADVNVGVVVQVAQRQQLQKQKEMAQTNLLSTAMKAGSITVRINDNLFLVL